ncbi:MAG: hypothetical protein F6J93_39800 [Oscillatoria sp. SIO1A7]|nr:hypothetical protein [Oscillatoria sp. SIO1A7]
MNTSKSPIETTNSEKDVQDLAPRGFAKHAEIISGRWAMLAFVSLLAYQVASRHGLLG